MMFCGCTRFYGNFFIWVDNGFNFYHLCRISSAVWTLIDVYAQTDKQYIQGFPHHIRPFIGVNCDFRD